MKPKQPVVKVSAGHSASVLSESSMIRPHIPHAGRKSQAVSKLVYEPLTNEPGDLSSSLAIDGKKLRPAPPPPTTAKLQKLSPANIEKTSPVIFASAEPLPAETAGKNGLAEGVSSPVSSEPSTPKTDTSSLTSLTIDKSVAAQPLPAGAEKDVVYNEDKSIKFASMEVLVGKMVSDKGGDASFMNHFLLTMNLHTTPDAFLDALTRHFREDSDMATKLRVFVVLMTWVEKLWNASTDPQLVARVREFAASSNMEMPSKKLVKLIDRKVGIDSEVPSSSSSSSASVDVTANTQQQQQQQKDYIFAEEVPAPIVPVSYLMGVRTPPAEVTLDSVDVREIARQLALGEIELFKAIKPWEFQNLNFARKDKTLAPNVHAYSRHFNAMSKWAAWRVLERKDLGERTRALEKLIELAEWSSKAQNYNAVNEIISACTSSAVYRLHKTWDAISPRHTAVFKELSELMAPAKSYAAFRNKLHTLHPPCVPYIGVYQTDLTFIEEGNPTMCDGLVNWKKCRLQASIIVEIQTYQQSPYSYFPVPWIKDYFLNLEPRNDDNEMWNASITIEPKERKQTSSDVSSDSQASTTTAATSTAGGLLPSSTASLPPASGLEAGKDVSDGACDDVRDDDNGVGGDSGLNDAERGRSGSSGSGNNNNNNSSKGKKRTIKVLLPGKSRFLLVPVSPDMIGQRIKEFALRRAASKGLIDRTDVADECWEFMCFSEFMPFGVAAYNETPIEFSENQFFTLYRRREMADIVYPDGFELGPMPPQIAVDYDAPLFTLSRVLRSLAKFRLPGSTDGNDKKSESEKRSVEDILFVRMRPKDNPSEKPEFVWLNSNLSLQEQDFVISKDKIVIVPSELLKRVSEGLLVSKMTAAAGARSTQQQLMKANSRTLTRCGVLTKQMLTGTVSTFRKGTLATEKEKRKYILGDNFLFCYRENAPQSPNKVWPLEFCNVSLGIIHNTQLCIAVKYIPRNSRSVSSSSRPRHHSNSSSTTTAAAAAAAAAIASTTTTTDDISSSSSCNGDNNGTSNNAGTASSSSFVGVSDGSSGGSNDGTINTGHRDDKADISLFAGGSDSSTRTWFSTLTQRSLVNHSTRVFGEKLDVLCHRDRSIVPIFLTDAIDRLIKKATRVENLLTTQLHPALLERYKDAINAGACPAASDPTELACLAQCVLMVFTELPEPLVPFSVYPSIVAYCKESKTVNVEGLRRIVSELSDASANALFCLLLFFKLWADENNTLRKAGATVGQVIMHPHENESSELHHPTSIIETAARFGEDMLCNFTKLSLRRLSADKDTNENVSANTPVPVTVFSQKDLDAIAAAVKSFSPYQLLLHVAAAADDNNNNSPSNNNNNCGENSNGSGSDGLCNEEVSVQGLSSSAPGAHISSLSESNSSSSSSINNSSNSSINNSSNNRSSAASGSQKKKYGMSLSARISQHFKRDKKSGSTLKGGHSALSETVTGPTEVNADSNNNNSNSGSGSAGTTASSSPRVGEGENEGGVKGEYSSLPQLPRLDGSGNGGNSNELNTDVRKKSNSSGGKTKK